MHLLHCAHIDCNAVSFDFIFVELTASWLLLFDLRPGIEHFGLNVEHLWCACI